MFMTPSQTRRDIQKYVDETARENKLSDREAEFLWRCALLLIGVSYAPRRYGK